MKPGLQGFAVHQCGRETNRSSTFFPHPKLLADPVRLPATTRPSDRGAIGVPIFWDHLGVWSALLLLTLSVKLSQTTL